MNDHTQQLADLLQQEIKAYSRLLQIERAKEKAIIANKAERLLEVLREEEPVTELAGELERQILQCRDSLAAEAGRPGITLREVIASLPAPRAQCMESLRTQLFGLAEEIRKVNQTNYLLLKQSIELLDEVLSAILGQSPAVKTYEGSGRMECADAGREMVSMKA